MLFISKKKKKISDNLKKKKKNNNVRFTKYAKTVTLILDLAFT
jgi:hypothetical protein